MRPCRSSAAAAVASALLWAAAADAADQTTSYRVGPLNDNAIPDSPLVPPLRPRWEIRIGHTKSNLVVADGRLFFVNHDGVKAELTAVEAATGRILWARSAGPGNGNWGLAYENGRLFMARLDAGSGDDGHVTAVAADSGAVAWEVTINELYGINAPPTATGGTLYVPAHDGAVHLYALRTSDGSQQWVSQTMLGGSESSPTVTADSVYLAYGGGQVYSIARDSGQFRWHYRGCCSGGGGSTVVFHNDLIYESSDANLVHEAATGRVVGSFPAYTGTGSIPAFSGDLGLFVPGRLVAVGSDGRERWTYSAFDSSDYVRWPLIVGRFAYVREGDRFVTGIDLATGLPVWCAEFIPPPGSGSYPLDTAGHPHAGEGLLFVPIGYGLVALEGGGSASGCPARSGGPGSDPATGGDPALSLSASRTDVSIGRRVRLTGVLTGTTNRASQTVRIDADRFPFGRFKRLATVRTAADGSFGARVRPRRNTRYRAVLVRDGRDVASPVLTVYADLPVTIRRLGVAGPRPRVRVTIRAPRGSRVRRRRVVFYLAGEADTVWQRVARRRWRARRRGLLLATAAYPRGRLVKQDRVLICTREKRDDGYGRPSPLEPLCGRPTLPRAPAGTASVRARVAR